MILITLQNWDAPLQILVSNLRKALGRSLTSSLDARVSQWKTTKLYKEMYSTNISFMDHHLETMKSHANRTLRIERVKPITRDEHRMAAYVTEETQNLEEARLKSRYQHHMKDAAENW